ncbi:MAG: hypothetical protein HRU41_41180, partial [Saprospiraceae bacterium]|nr:hypothetical protein [Saprospiraceae bacterium]
DILRGTDLMLKRNSRVEQRAARNGIPATKLKDVRPMMEAAAEQEKR